MKLKRILSIILTASIIATSFSSVAQISAQTEEEAYNQAAQVTIAEEASVQTVSIPAESTKEFIISIEDNFESFMTTSELWESNYKIKLTCDIDMKGKAFNPIKEFDGVFDGCGYTIRNLKIQNKSAKGKNDELAIINTLNENAEIKNVKFCNYNIECESGIEKAASLIVTNHGTISGVNIINGSINNIGKKANAAGYVLNNEEDGIIENCFVCMNNKDSNIKFGFVGTNLGKIIKCSTAVSVNSKDTAGGFCGSNLGEINDCKSEGSVKAKASNGITICGGFIVENSGMIKNCSSTGAVEGQEFTGGFAGINGDKGEISLCKAICDVKSHTYIASINCGGFVGLDAGKIEDCSFDGKVYGCVDSEKVVGIAVGVTVGVLLTIAGICLTVKYFKYKPESKTQTDIDAYNQAKTNLDQASTNFNQTEDLYEKSRNNLYEAEENLKNARNVPDQIEKDFWNENDCINNSGFIERRAQCFDRIKEAQENIKTAEDNFMKASNNCLQLKDSCNIAKNNFKRVKIDYYNVITKLFFKDSFVITLLAGLFVVGAASGVVTGSAAGLIARNKCANVGAFCGFNAGEISKCSANNSLFKAKTLYNKYNMCGGFVGINGETGTIKDSVATGNEISNKTYTGGHLGGFVGENSGKIENGITKVSVANGKCTGGFCGSNTGEISGSRSEGNAIANAKTVETKCGGFVGNNDKQGKISSCISKGSAEGQEYVGGFCGDNTGEISKSKSEGNATAKTVSNTNRCGGF
ncbi:MAG: hypothetical protein K2G97_02235, partial [Oscillospiraceae bacterium]|nr:hypothetical protein [Oscillospiraceae bacterium]